MIRGSWKRWLSLALASVALMQLPSTPPGTQAVFSNSLSGAVNQLAGAVFVPNVAPVVTKVKTGVNMKLSWPEVVTTSGATVTYLVKRISPGGTAVNVCTAVGSITVVAGVVSCVDKSAGASPSYTEQPVVVFNGQVTWSLPPSTPA